MKDLDFLSFAERAPAPLCRDQRQNKSYTRRTLVQTDILVCTAAFATVAFLSRSCARPLLLDTKKEIFAL